MNVKLSIENILELATRKAKHTHGGVDIVQIAKELGIEVVAISDCDPLFNAAIKYLPEENRFQIEVNDSHSRNRVRFSIAHEIAHFILHKDRIVNEGMLSRSTQPEENIEKQADDLAGRLLIPDDVLEEFLKNNNVTKELEITTDQISWISNHFRVSIIVAAIRLRNFGYSVPYISFSYVT